MDQINPAEVLARAARRDAVFRKKTEARAETLQKFWSKKILIGQRVVNKVTRYTGEVYKLLSNGVQVWITYKVGQLHTENWEWEIIATRQPRLIKRYPRPFRFPRDKPTACCHCKIGRMVVLSAKKDKVVCTRCGFLVGSESFPNRIRRATEMLRKQSQETNDRPKGKKGGRKTRLTGRKDPSPSKLRKGKTEGDLVVRPPRAEETGGSNETSSTSEVLGAPSIPTGAEVPTPEVQGYPTFSAVTKESEREVTERGNDPALTHLPTCPWRLGMAPAICLCGHAQLHQIIGGTSVH